MGDRPPALNLSVVARLSEVGACRRVYFDVPDINSLS